MSEKQSEHAEVGKITDTTLRRMQERVGVEVPEPRRYHNDVVTQDGSRHFCWATGMTILFTVMPTMPKTLAGAASSPRPGLPTPWARMTSHPYPQNLNKS